jgi:hypothetical protein
MARYEEFYEKVLAEESKGESAKVVCTKDCRQRLLICRFFFLLCCSSDRPLMVLRVLREAYFETRRPNRIFGGRPFSRWQRCFMRAIPLQH